VVTETQSDGQKAQKFYDDFNAFFGGK